MRRAKDRSHVFTIRFGSDNKDRKKGGVEEMRCEREREKRKVPEQKVG